MRRLGLPLLLVTLFPLQVLAVGEEFKIETTGTEYCGDLDVNKFNASNNLDLWVRVVSDNELLVSATPNFDPAFTFSMRGYTYLTGPTTAAFVGGAHLPGDAFATIQGTAKFDRRTGAVTSLTGTFIQSDVFFLGCFSSGKFKSQQVS